MLLVNVLCEQIRPSHSRVVFADGVLASLLLGAVAIVNAAIPVCASKDGLFPRLLPHGIKIKEKAK